MDIIWQDLRYGFRCIRRNLQFSLVVIFTLALGIGANTTIFSVVNAVLLESLPFRDADRLQSVWKEVPSKSGTANGKVRTSPPDFREWRARNNVFQDLAAYYVSGINVSGGGEPERVSYAPVTANLFPLLGVDPVQGRIFRPEEEQYGNHRVVILSHGLWQRRFGGDVGVIGKTVELDAEPYSVVGVMPRDFWFPQMPPRVDLWIPMAFEPNSFLNTRKNFFLSVIGRLKPKVTTLEAQTNMRSIGNALANEYKENAGSSATASPFREGIVGDVKPVLLVLWGAVCFLLLIVCVNVANLLLARAPTRKNELALRAAIGAPRGRLIRQLLSESLIFALLGGLGGVGLAYLGIDALSAYIPPHLTLGLSIGISSKVLVFALALSLLTSVMIGVIPALQASRSNLLELLKETGRGAVAGVRAFSRNALIVVQVSLTLVLLIGGSLMIKSLYRLQNVAPGFRADNALTMQISLPNLKYPEPERKAVFFADVHEKINALPGVQSAGVTAALPLAGAMYLKRASIEGGPIPSSLSQVPRVLYRQIGPDYCLAMGIPLLQGRHFTKQDSGASLQVAIVDEAFVHTLSPAQNPIGRRIWLGPPPNLSSDRFPYLEIVGVVGNVKFGGLDEDFYPTVYVPHLQGGTETLGAMSLAVRTTSDPLRLASTIRQQILTIDRSQPVIDVKTMDQALSESLSTQRFNMLLLIIFGTIALSLSAIGVYGLLEYFVAQRTREIGVRLALGAGRTDILKLVLKQGLAPVLIGIGIGLGASLGLTGLMASMLFEISARDPAIFLWATVVLIGVAGLACCLPAHRATRVAPILALRQD